MLLILMVVLSLVLAWVPLERTLRMILSAGLILVAVLLLGGVFPYSGPLLR